MNSLQLISAIRSGGSNRTERRYLDFCVSGQSLKEVLGQKGTDLITLFGWGNNRDYDEYILRVFNFPVSCLDSETFVWTFAEVLLSGLSQASSTSER